MMNAISSPAEANTVLTLLTLLKNPEAAEKRLADLMAAEDHAKQAADAANKLRLDAEATHAAAGKREQEVSAREAGVAEREHKAADLAAALAARERSVHLAESAHADKVQNTSDDLAKREKHIAAQESELANTMAQAEADAAASAKLKTELEQRIARIKAAAGL